MILHTDHCQRSWLPWFDGLMAANEDYFAKNGEPLFSSHMLDLSEEPLGENIDICVEVSTARPEPVTRSANPRQGPNP